MHPPFTDNSFNFHKSYRFKPFMVSFKRSVALMAAVLATFSLVSMLTKMSEIQTTLTLLLDAERTNRIQISGPVSRGSERFGDRFFPPPIFHSSEYWSQLKDVHDMTEEDMLRYMHWSDRHSCFLTYDFGGKLHTHRANNRIGIDGQKAICMDSGVAPVPGRCFVFSIGINDEWSFDEQIEKYGCRVFAFDPSMSQGDHNHSAQIHFFNLGLGGQDTDHGVNGWKMRTFTSLYEMTENYHGGAPIDIVKADVEGSEWEVLPQIMESGMLDKIKQIALEVHYTPETLRDNLQVLKKLEQTGMVRFALRHNFFVPSLISGRQDSYLFELAWFNSKFKDSDPMWR